MVGSGPAGLYGADALLKRGASVDVFEKQFAPYGLVRFGVAPDHQKIKRIQTVFEKILAQKRLRFFGNVTIGRDLSIQELQEHYDQILITMGSSGARQLQIPGEELPGSLSATELVNWYNGHPDFVSKAPALDCERVVVVGMGNVAIDIARILLRDPAELAATDIPRAALEVLRKSQVKEVMLLARRGPNQAAFDEREVRQLAELKGVELVVQGYISKRKTKKSDFIAAFPRLVPSTKDRNFVPGFGTNETKSSAEGKLRGISGDRRPPVLVGGGEIGHELQARGTGQCKRRVVLRFCSSPVEISGAENGEELRVSSLRVERNDLVESAARMRAVGTGEFEEITAGLIVRAIGYQGSALLGVPFCENTSTIPHCEGRVLLEQGGSVVSGLYVAGWIKRGPTGLIGTNKACAVQTVASMEKDLDQVGPSREPDAIVRLLQAKGVSVITANDWALLNRAEKEAGARTQCAREKFLSLRQALEVLGRRAQPECS